jgi:hypothetical protein
MSPSKLRRHLEDLHRYVKYAEIARAAGTSKQMLRYWLHAHPDSESIDPQKGIDTLIGLCEKIERSKRIEEKDWDKLKRFINISVFAKEIFGKSQSTIGINITRNGADHYRSEIQQICKLLLNITEKNKPKLKLKPKLALRPKKR